MVKIRSVFTFLPFWNRKPNLTHIGGTEPSEKLKIQIRNGSVGSGSKIPTSGFQLNFGKEEVKERKERGRGDDV